MFDCKLVENEEIIVVDNQARILENDKLFDVLIAITTYRLIIFNDVNKEIEHMEILRIIKAVNPLPNYEMLVSIKLNDIVSVNTNNEYSEYKINNGKIIKILSEEVEMYIRKYLEK